MARQAEPARNGPRGSGEKTGGRNVPVRTFRPACREAERRSGLGLYMLPWSVWSSRAARNTRIERCRMVCTGSRKDFVSDCFHNGTKEQPSGNLRAAVFCQNFVKGSAGTRSADGADVVDGQQQSGAFAVALGAEQALVGADVGGKGAHAAGKSASPEQIRSSLRRRTRRAERARRARCRPGARARRRAGKTRRAC